MYADGQYKSLSETFGGGTLVVNLRSIRENTLGESVKILHLEEI